MRVFACYVVSKLQRHQCPTFGALRPRTQRTNGQLHFYIYRLSTTNTCLRYDRLCSLVVRAPGYRMEMYCASCEVRTQFMYVM
jgi:hypothetical protein